MGQQRDCFRSNREGLTTMQQQHYIPPALRPPQRRGWRSLLVLLGVGISPPALFFGLLLRRVADHSWDSQDRWSGIWAFAIFFIIGYALLAWFGHIYALFWHALSFDVLHGSANYTFVVLLEVWIYHVLLAPVFALVLEWVEPQTRTFIRQPRRPQPATNVEPPQEPTPVREDTPAVSRPAVPHIIVQTPTSVHGSAIIGQPLEGDLWQWVEDGWFTWPEWVLNEGALILARPGSGKTKTAMRLAYTARTVYERKVYYFDGKGDWDTAAEFDLVMRAAGCQRVGMFPCDRHNGWFGSREEIVTRLMNCQVFSDSYYEGHTLNILNDAFYLPGHDMPRNSQEFLDRIYPPTIKALYKGMERYTYYQALRPDVLWGAHGRYNALFNVVGNSLDGEHGYGYWDAAYYLLDQKRLQKKESTFAKLLLDDFELYVAMRNASVPASRRRPIMLIIDDYSAFSDTVPIHNLMERLRGAGVAVVAIAHGMESLGTEREAKRLLTSAGTVILHACSLPKELIAVAGTRQTPDFVYHMQQDDTAGSQGSVLDQSGHVTIHRREESSIDPNDVQQLAKGESFWTSGGFYQRVQVEMVPAAKALIEERKEQLQLLDHQEREQYQAQQAARLMLPVKTTTAKVARKQKLQQKPRPATPVTPTNQTAGPEPRPNALASGSQNGPMSQRSDAQTAPLIQQPQQAGIPAPDADQTNPDGQTRGTGQADTPPPAKPKKLQDLL
jgi:hypothetical protein